MKITQDPLLYSDLSGHWNPREYHHKPLGKMPRQRCGVFIGKLVRKEPTTKRPKAKKPGLLAAFSFFWLFCCVFFGFPEGQVGVITLSKFQWNG